MKFTLSWLKDHLETITDADGIATRLTALGLEVENIDDPAKTLKGFVVGQVVTCHKHPDADRLRVTTIDTGREKLQVVCGAPNCREGLKVVFAPAGSHIPGSGITLAKTKIRGQESNGMLCSEKELCLSDDSNGIIELPDHAPVGADVALALGVTDPVIEIAITPNRIDCAGVRGIARDLAAAGAGKLKPLDAEKVPGTFKNPVTVAIDSEANNACPLFIGRTIRGVKNGPSPKWLQERLKRVGQKPISALVDITNYLTLDLCRPLHVFDADRLKGNIRVRLSRRGETLAALNDKTYELDDGMTVVCDDSGVLGLGGIMGGTASSVGPGTVSVYLECAYFDPLCTAVTGRKLQIDSDARWRFERGIDPSSTESGIEIATRMILDICGGEASEITAAGKAPLPAKTISFRPGRVKSLGGCEIDPAAQKKIITALGFNIDAANDVWTLTPPSWRVDVDGEADIVEEVLRINGYDQIPTVPVTQPEGYRGGALNDLQQRVIASRHALAARGIYETVTWAFMPGKFADMFGANDRKDKAALTLTNPISQDLDTLRPSILPNLIVAAQKNADRGYFDAALFEIAKCYHSAESCGEAVMATGLRMGAARPRHWTGPLRPVDAIDAKADALAVLDACGLNPASIQIMTTDLPGWYHPGRAGILKLGPTVLGYFGEMHPETLAAMKADGPMAGFEIFMDALPAPKKKDGFKRPLLALSPFQPLTRDFAFIVDTAVSADKMLRCVRAADPALIKTAEIFDVYAGPHVGEGKKSIALTVTLQPRDKTLTDAEIETLSQKIIADIQKSTGGVLRV